MTIVITLGFFYKDYIPLIFALKLDKEEIHYNPSDIFSEIKKVQPIQYGHYISQNFTQLLYRIYGLHTNGYFDSPNYFNLLKIL